jgi:hypothetical protein
LIRHQGSVWAYVMHPGGRFERRLVEGAIPEKEGLFVAQGFSPGEIVATDGAAGLFATELSRAGAGSK